MKPQRTFIANVGDPSIENAGPDAIEKDIDNINKMFDPSSTHQNGESGGVKSENLNTELSGRISGNEANLVTHKQSSDHDSRYFTESELSSTVDGSSGADKIGATAINGVIGTTPQAIMEDLKAQIDTKTPILNAEKQGFDTVTPTPVSATGDVAWNTSRETLDVKLSSQVTGQMFQESHIYVRNTSGSAINDGTLVMRTGINADRITVAPAVCNGSIPATDILGVTTEAIANNSNGRITVFGEINGLNTSAYTIGTELWGNPSVAGGLTNTKPSAPNLKVSVGIVTKSHGTNGILLVNMNHGSVLGGTDSNVELTGISEKDLISYDASTGIWKNRTINSAGVVGLTGDQTVAGVKTFSSSPIVPAPTTDMQAATKKYVDDKALTVGDPHWKAPVATKALLPVVGNSLGDIRSVFDDGDGKQAVYECKATTGTIDQQWAKIADVDWLTEEAVRVANENSRISAEETRVSNENTRIANEEDRIEAELLRQAHITDLNNPHQVTLAQVGGASATHTHAQSDIMNLTSDLAGKATKPTNESTATNGQVLTSNGDGTSTYKDSVGQVKNNYTATSAPTQGDDSADGYAVGSEWIDVTNDISYKCLDATEGLAVWQSYTVSTSTSTKRYGFRRERGNSDPTARITYLHDAVGLTPAYMNTGTGNFDYGGWQTFINDVSRPVMLKTDGTVDYELSRTDFTKKADGVTASDVSNTAYGGNAMIEFRKYKWVYRYSDATYDYVIFSNEQYNSEYKAYAHTNANGNIKDAFYWGAFKGSNISSKLRSIADQTIMVSQTRNTEADYADNNGSGYYTIYHSGWVFIGDLLTLISKSDDSQTKFGTGRNGSSSALATGTLKALPMFKGYTDNTSDVKVFGIEGFWGNVWEGMAGLVFNGNIKTKMTPPYNFDGSGYTDTGLDPSGTNGGYISQATVNDASGWFPTVASGSASTYYCDGLWYNTAQVDYALVGGVWAYGSHVGSRYVDLDALASDTNTNIGSRLSYLNPA